MQHAWDASPQLHQRKTIEFDETGVKVQDALPVSTEDKRKFFQSSAEKSFRLAGEPQ